MRALREQGQGHGHSPVPREHLGPWVERWPWGGKGVVQRCSPRTEGLPSVPSGPGAGGPPCRVPWWQEGEPTWEVTQPPVSSATRGRGLPCGVRVTLEVISVRTPWSSSFDQYSLSTCCGGGRWGQTGNQTPGSLPSGADVWCGDRRRVQSVLWELAGGGRCPWRRRRAEGGGRRRHSLSAQQGFCDRGTVSTKAGLKMGGTTPADGPVVQRSCWATGLLE